MTTVVLAIAAGLALAVALILAVTDIDSRLILGWSAFAAFMLLFLAAVWLEVLA